MLRALHLCVAMIVLLFALSSLAEVPQQINYQGQLTTSSGDPIPDTTLTLTFAIYGQPVGGTAIWTSGPQSVVVQQGVFQYTLGSVVPLYYGYLPGSAPRYLGISVESDAEMTPRTELKSVPHAYRVGTLDGALGGGVKGSIDLSEDIYSQDDHFEIFFPSNILFQSESDIGDDFYIGNNFHMQMGAGIVRIGNGGSVITLDGPNESISTAGGILNIVDKAIIGPRNVNTGQHAFVAGDSNAVSGDHCVVSGGTENIADGPQCTVGGGIRNQASGLQGTVGGGEGNTALARLATVAGGYNNVAGWSFSSVGGGHSNQATGDVSVVAGGGGNIASAWGAAVGGGENNVASDTGACIPGGHSNEASGDFSLAAGRRAKSIHPGTFVWADNTDVDFSSTADNQFLIRASGGVGIGTNNPLGALEVAGVIHSSSGGFRFPDGSVQMTSATVGTDDGDWNWSGGNLCVNSPLVGIGTCFPSYKLHVVGTVYSSTGGFRFPDATVQTTAASGAWSDDGTDLWTDISGNVGIGTTSPTEKLNVVGNICYTGSIGACSDERYKRDVTTLSGSFENLMKLRGVRYRWRTEQYPDRDFDDNAHLGFIAQEVEPLFPEMVMTDDDGYKSVDYGRLTPVLVEAIKEQQQTIESLNERVEKMERLVNQLVESNGDRTDSELGMH